MFRFIVLASVLVLSVQGQYHQDPRTAAIISEKRYLSGDGTFGAAYQQEDGTDFLEETDADGTRHGSYSYVDPTGKKHTVSYTAGKDGFRPVGDHLPVAPPAPPHALLAAQAAPHYNNYDAGNAGDFDDGQYDPRYNDPNFAGNGHHQQHHVPAPAPAPAPIQHQPTYVQRPIPQQQQYVPQQQHYNNDNYATQYQSTTPAPHRFQPPANYEIAY